MATDYPIFLIEMQESIADKLKERLVGKLQPDEFEVISREVVESVRELHAGDLIYVPKVASWECKKKHDEIWKDFNGVNHHELSQKYKISLNHVYRVLRRFQRKNKSQLDWCV